MLIVDRPSLSISDRCRYLCERSRPNLNILVDLSIIKMNGLEYFCDAKMGLEWTPPKDPMSGSHLGGYVNLSTVDRNNGSGTRSYAVTGYLTPNSARYNLKVLTEATVTQVVLTKSAGVPAATGVTFLSNGNEFTVSAKREVILAAGPVQTPQILELSGIEKRGILQSAGLQCTIENDRVGEQLVDHPVTVFFVRHGQWGDISGSSESRGRSRRSYAETWAW